jgi:hypothetical protein
MGARNIYLTADDFSKLESIAKEFGIKPNYHSHVHIMDIRDVHIREGDTLTTISPDSWIVDLIVAMANRILE